MRDECRAAKSSCRSFCPACVGFATVGQLSRGDQRLARGTPGSHSDSLRSAGAGLPSNQLSSYFDQIVLDKGKCFRIIFAIPAKVHTRTSGNMSEMPSSCFFAALQCCLCLCAYPKDRNCQCLRAQG